ncbi:putative tail protein [Listeria phage LP-013]|uniref:Putative tail protein n=1 Tax=Listeria phage LP-013 TaxID=2590047 RepID=A0A514U6S1_9CAUD|nr:putative tail protein [Listeria phage LP-013]
MADIRVVVTADTAGFTRKMNAAARSLEKFNMAAVAAGASTKTSFGGMNKGMDEVNRRVNNFGGRGKTKMQSFGQNVNSLSKSLLGVPIAAASAGAAVYGVGKFVNSSVKAYAKFNQVITDANVISNGNKKTFEQLSAVTLDMSKKTGHSAESIGESFTDLAKRGYTVADSIKILPALLNAADASQEDLSITTDTVSAALKTWHMEASEAGGVADKLAMASDATAAGMKDMSYVFKYAGAPAQQLGISISEVAAAAGLLRDRGISASTAGTGLRKMFISLVNPTKNGAEAMKSIGFSATDASGKFKSIGTIINDLNKEMAGMSSVERSKMVTQMFGVTAMPSVLQLLNAGGDAFEDMTKKIENSAGKSDSVAKKMRATTEGSINRMKASWESLKIAVGESIDGMVKGGLDVLTKGLNKVTDAFSEFNKGAKEAKRQNEDLKKSTKDKGEKGDLVSAESIYKDKKVFDEKAIELYGKEEGTKKMNSPMNDDLTRAEQQRTTYAKMIQGSKDLAAQYGVEGKAWNSLSNTTKAGLGSVLAYSNKVKFITSGNMEAYKQTSKSAYEAVSQIAVATLTMEGNKLKEFSASKVQTIKDANTSALTAQQEGLSSQQNILATFFEKNKNMTDEDKYFAIKTVKDSNQEKQALMMKYNEQQLALVNDLQSKDIGIRNAALAKYQSIEQEKNTLLLQAEQGTNDQLLAQIEYFENSRQTISKESKDKIIANAEDQRNKTVNASMEQAAQTIAAINGMSDEQIAATGRTKAQLIADATQQADETIRQADIMYNEVMDKIEKLEQGAKDSKPTIIVSAETSDAENKMNAFKSKWDKAQFTASVKIVQGVVNTPGGGIGKVAVQKKNQNKYFGDNWISRAHGGMTPSGLPLGVSTGQKSVANTTNQKFARGGVTYAEAGREMVLPLANATYMRPFARSIARELDDGNNPATPVITVPLYINGREFARATSDDMSRAQTNKTNTNNRYKGV